GGCPARRDPMIDIASKCYVEERNRSTHVLAPTDTNQRVARFPALYQNECLDRTLIFPYRWKGDRASYFRSAKRARPARLWRPELKPVMYRRHGWLLQTPQPCLGDNVRLHQGGAPLASLSGICAPR